jgi:hypothetical protein
MAHRRGPRSPQRSIRGGIGRRPPIVAPNLPIPVGPGDFDVEGWRDERLPWTGAHGGSVELFQDQLMRKFGGGRIKAKKSGGKIKAKKSGGKIKAKKK